MAPGGPTSRPTRRRPGPSTRRRRGGRGPGPMATGPPSAGGGSAAARPRRPPAPGTRGSARPVPPRSTTTDGMAPATTMSKRALSWGTASASGVPRSAMTASVPREVGQDRESVPMSIGHAHDGFDDRTAGEGGQVRWSPTPATFGGMTTDTVPRTVLPPERATPSRVEGTSTVPVSRRRKTRRVERAPNRWNAGGAEG